MDRPILWVVPFSMNTFGIFFFFVISTIITNKAALSEGNG